MHHKSFTLCNIILYNPHLYIWYVGLIETYFATARQNCIGNSRSQTKTWILENWTMETAWKKLPRRLFHKYIRYSNYTSAVNSILGRQSRRPCGCAYHSGPQQNLTGFRRQFSVSVVPRITSCGCKAPGLRYAGKIGQLQPVSNTYTTYLLTLAGFALFFVGWPNYKSIMAIAIHLLCSVRLDRTLERFWRRCLWLYVCVCIVLCIVTKCWQNFFWTSLHIIYRLIKVWNAPHVSQV